MQEDQQPTQGLVMDISSLPDTALVPLSWVRQHFVPKVDSSARDMTTVELSKHLGRSAGWWQDMARTGKIRGAYQVGVGSPWYIPLEDATVFLHAYRESQTESRRKRARRPWKGPQAA